MEKVTFFVEDSIGYITLNDPEHGNAFDLPFERELLDKLNQCRFDPRVHVVVLRAEGKIFSGGGNVGSLLEAAAEPDRFRADIDESMVLPGAISRTIRGMSKPVIASLHGAVAGAAVSIAMMCDLRVAASNTLFVVPFTNIGLIPDAGGVCALSRILGAAKATEIAMLNQNVEAEEALRLGMLTEITQPDQLEERTKKLANKLARGPLKTYEKIKMLVNQSCYSGLDSILNNEAAYMGECLRSADCLEGLKAFREKRRPNFTGN